MMRWMVAKPLSLSEEQSRAVHLFGSDIGLSASAGSGKTTVLVEKYLEALKAHKCSPQNILAVTFTDKAAASMKQRLVRRCRDLGLHTVVRELEGAWIGTLHSFCARVLRENPVECGVDPQFKILPQGEQDMWMAELLEEIFRENAEDISVNKLLVDYGEDMILNGIRALYDIDRAHARDPRLLDIPLFEEERRSLERQIMEGSSELEQIYAGQRTLSPSQTRQRSLTKQMPEIFKRHTHPSWERWRAVTDLLEGFDLKSPKMKPTTAALKETGARWSLLELQALSLDIKKAFLRVFEVFRSRYESRKREKGLYDFEDLLFLAHRALAGDGDPQKALRSRIQKQFEAIFVDEYQDTSQLQAKILDRIKKHANLFVVGDVFQSIYGFRHASPEIFEEAMKSSQRLELRENYRSRQEILDFVNTLFGGIFSGRFAPMSAVRKHSLTADPCIEWVCVPKEDELSLEACRIWEARTIANRIRELVDSGFILDDEKGRRSLQFKDVAILFRKTTSSRIFEKELEACAIPYFVYKGKGFFERLEIKDLMQVLRVINNAHEDIPLAAVLRSPLVQLSDDALFWLAKARTAPADSFYDALCRWESVSELAEPDRTKIRRFMALLTELKNAKERRTVSQLIREMLSRTAYEAKVLAQADGELAQANIQKLLEMAESYEENNASDLNGFTRYIQRMSDSEEAEPEARLIGEEENVVRILTVHAAKGLEFPCVIFADLGGDIRPKNYTSFDASPETGLGLKLKIPGTFHFEADHSLTQLKEERARKEMAEQSRLLYVAMTRAKDHLILSGVMSKSSWTETLAKTLELDGAVPGQAAVYGNTPIKIVEIVKQRKVAARPILVKPADQLFAIRSITQNASAILERLKVTPKPYQMLEDITVSDVLSVVTHEEIEMLPQAPPHDEDEIPRNEYGTLFHKLMECSIRSSQRGRVTASLFERLTRSLSASQKTEMGKSFESFWATNLSKDILASKRVYPEMPFIYKTPYGLLKGQIDLLYEKADGEWVVLDYKTNRVQPDGLEAVARRYEWQLGLYALIFKELFGRMPTKGILYFSSINKFTETIYTEPILDKLSKELEAIYPKVAFSE